MTSERQATTLATSTERLAALRGNCMGAGVLVIIQFGLGAGVNLYVALPRHRSFFSTVFGSAALAAHAVVALALLAAGIAALIRAARARRAIVPTSAGLAAIVVAGAGGASFVGSGSDGASLLMALAAAAAMFCYLA